MISAYLGAFSPKLRTVIRISQVAVREIEENRAVDFVTQDVPAFKDGASKEPFHSGEERKISRRQIRRVGGRNRASEKLLLCARQCAVGSFRLMLRFYCCPSSALSVCIAKEINPRGPRESKKRVGISLRQC